MEIKGIKCCGKPVVGSCEHNYSCLVCGNGQGCSPDPCHPMEIRLVSSDELVQYISGQGVEVYPAWKTDDHSTV